MWLVFPSHPRAEEDAKRGRAVQCIIHAFFQRCIYRHNAYSVLKKTEQVKENTWQELNVSSSFSAAVDFMDNFKVSYLHDFASPI